VSVVSRRRLTAADRERLRAEIDRRRREQLAQQGDGPSDLDRELFAEFAAERSSLRQPWQRTRA
jgi:hypothetical protein